MFGPITRFAIHCVGAAFGVLALLFALSIWRLASGPVSLAFLAPYVESALIREKSALHISFDDLVLTWAGWERTFDIRAIGVRVLTSDGTTVSEVPEMAIGLSVPALSRGLIAPTRLEMFGPRVRLVRRADGGVDVGLGEKIAADEIGFGEALLQDLLLPPDPGRAMGYLQSISVVDARMVFDDEARGSLWIAPEARIAVERHRRGIHAESLLTLDIDGQPIGLTATADYDADDRMIEVGLDLIDADPSRLAGISPHLAPLASIAVPLSGRLVLEAGADGELLEMRFDLAGGAGRVAAPVSFDSGTHFDVESVRAKGKLDGGFTRLVVEQLDVDFGGPTLALAGEMAGDPAAPEVTGELTVSGVAAGELGRYWPESLAPRGRAWLIERMTTGTVEEVTVRLALKASDWTGTVPEAAAAGTFRIADADLRYHEELPKAEGLDIAGRFDASTLEANIGSGTAGPVAVRGGTLMLHRLDSGTGAADIAVALRGSLSETLALLRQPPFDHESFAGVDPSSIQGVIDGDLNISIPLSDSIDPAALAFNIDADIDGLAVAPGGLGSLIANRSISGGKASILLDRGGFDLAGELRVDGVPLDIHWRENFALAQNGDPRRRIDVRGRLDRDARLRLDLDQPWLDGIIDVDARLVARAGAPLSVVADIGAEDAVLFVPALDWRKPPGAPAQARLLFAAADGSISRLEHFDVRADELSLAGSAERVSDGTWVIAVDHLRSGMNDMAGEVLVRENGELAIEVRGASVDLRPYLQANESLAEAIHPSRPFDWAGHVDVVVLNNGALLHDVRASAVHDGEVIRSASIAGRLDGSHDTLLRIDGGSTNRFLTVTSASAGRLLDALGITDKIVGGALHVDAVIDDRQTDRPVVGTIGIKGFSVVDAPILAKLLNILSLTGALEMLAGDGIPFDRLHAPFVYRDDVLTLANARAAGLSLGITADGDIALDRDEVDLSGTIAPAYLLNSALGNIPIIGDIITGGQGGEVFAATYRARGPVSDSTVMVNPLSVLAPGILRELFRDFEPGGESGAADTP